MRNGMTPKAACEDALGRMIRRHPAFTGAIVAVDKHGNHGGAGHGMTFSAINQHMSS
jgi:N4-(beta-N-acetylglucosaminyl)-L-asparaginase